MTAQRYVYQLYYRDPSDYILVNVELRAAYERKYLCGRCRAFRRDALFPEPIDLRIDQLAEQRPLGSVYELAIGVIRADLRELLLPWLGEFAFGQCFDRSGHCVPRYSTFYCRRSVTARWGSGTRYRQCSECGVVRPQSDTARGERYLLSYDVGDLELFQTHTSATFVSEIVMGQLNVRSARIPGLKVGRYKLLDRPVDGARLPTDPPDVVGEPPVIF